MDQDSKIKLRSLLIQNKSFLKTLHFSNALANRTILSFANEIEVNLLLKILYFIVIGQIPIKKNHFQFLIKSKKKNLLQKTLGSKSAIQNIC